jgi:hypothetical protein
MGVEGSGEISASVVLHTRSLKVETKNFCCGALGSDTEPASRSQPDALEAGTLTRTQKHRREATANKNAGLAQLLAFWVDDANSIRGQELVLLTLESIRDDVVQATTTNGKRVSDPQVVRDYLNEQIAELRKLWKMVDASD